jgi:hypothetical protein
LFAQNIDKSKFSAPGNLPDRYYENPVTNTPDVNPPSPADQPKPDLKGTDAVNPIAIGQAGNAWGFATCGRPSYGPTTT